MALHKFVIESANNINIVFLYMTYYINIVFICMTYYINIVFIYI